MLASAIVLRRRANVRNMARDRAATTNIATLPCRRRGVSGRVSVDPASVPDRPRCTDLSVRTAQGDPAVDGGAVAGDLDVTPTSTAPDGA